MTRRPPRLAARDTRPREIGAVTKPHTNRLRVALAFPNTYRVGMSNLGFQWVYRLFNDLEAVVCERVFLPPVDDRTDRHASRSPLTTIESQMAIGDADILAFSIAFEGDYPNVVSMLRRAGLPIRSADRGDRHPIVVAGGAVAFLNPEPIAPFIDVFAVGEGEALVPALAAHAAAASGRADLVRRLTGEPGFYVPASVEVAYGDGDDHRVAGFAPSGRARVPVRRVLMPAASRATPPSTTVFTPDTEFGSRLLLEVVRGCPNLCRFCWAGHSYLPVRPFDADAILRAAEAARPLASSVGLVSIALCDHPEIVAILEGVHGMGYRVSPASLRLDDLTEPVVRILVASGERTLTIAPEAGSDRLRRVANKRIDNARILDTADMLFANGVENLKLYFMIGLPTEEDEDLVAIRDLTLAIRDRMMRRGRPRGRVGRLVASVNAFVPKPGTPWQWLPMTRPDEIGRKVRRLRSLVSDLDNVQVSIKSERQSIFQALLAVGDRRVARAVELAEINGGHWRAAIEEAGIDLDHDLFRDRRADLVLPWDVVDAGFPRRALRAGFESQEHTTTGAGEAACSTPGEPVDADAGDPAPVSGVEHHPSNSGEPASANLTLPVPPQPVPPAIEAGRSPELQDSGAPALAAPGQRACRGANRRPHEPGDDR